MIYLIAVLSILLIAFVSFVIINYIKIRKGKRLLISNEDIKLCIAEFKLITEKKSTLSATQRAQVIDIIDNLVKYKRIKLTDLK